MSGINKSFIVGVDFADNGDTGVLTVGEQKNGKVNIINAFQGQDAFEIYKKLTTKPLPEKQQKSSFTK